jgi:hypothetical protein
VFFSTIKIIVIYSQTASNYLLKMAWSRIIRFLNDEDRIVFGEPEIKTVTELVEKCQAKTLYASELEGNSPFALSPTGRKVRVQRLLEVLTPADVPIVRCIGLNYMKHSTFYKMFHLLFH